MEKEAGLRDYLRGWVVQLAASLPVLLLVWFPDPTREEEGWVWEPDYCRSTARNIDVPYPSTMFSGGFLSSLEDARTT